MRAVSVSCTFASLFFLCYYQSFVATNGRASRLFYHVPCTFVESAPGGKASTSSSAIGAKDVIVCNHTSFVEILYLSRRFSPVFVFVNDEGASKGLVHVCGILETLYRSFASPVAHDRSTVRLRTIATLRD